MDKLPKLWENSNKLAILAGLGLFSACGWYIHKLKQQIELLKKYSCLEPKQGMVELIGHTPIVKLETLSKLTKCEIYVKTELTD